MAFTVTSRGTNDTGTSTAATVSVGAFTPSASSLLIFYGHAENDNGADVNPTASTPSGGSLTWTLISKLDGATAVSTPYEKTGGLWRAPVGGSPSSMSVTWDGSSTNNCWYTAGCFDITGHDTGAPIVQVATPQGADPAGASNPSETVTLTSTPSTGNLVVAAFSSSVVTASAMAAPTIGGQAMTRVQGTDPNDYEQHIIYYRVITGAESNNVITCSNMGGNENYATLAFAFEVAAASGGSQSITPTGPTVSVTPGTVTIGESITPTGPTITVTAGTLTVTASQAITATGASVSVSAGSPVVFIDNGLWPTTVDVGGRLLLDQNGDPWQMVGDAAWSVIGQLSSAEMDTYLGGLAGYGFNTAMVSLIEGEYSDDPPNDANGNAPYSGTMFQSTPTEAYWTTVDTFISKAAALGVTVLATPAYLGFSTDGIAAEVAAASNAQMLAYGEFLGARYKDFPNIIWMAGGDRTSVSATLLDRIDNLMTGIGNEDTSHLMTGHTADGATSDDVWGAYSWLDINTAYEVAEDPVSSANAGATGDAYADTPTRPVIYVEGKYEGDTSRTPTIGYGDMELRYQMWGPMLAGAIGAVFGNGVRWHFNSTNAGIYAQTGVTWQETLNDVDGDDELGTIHVGVLADFVASFTRDEWGALVPDTTDTFLTGGEGTSTARAAAAFSGDYGLVYFPSSRGSITVDTTEMTGTGNVRLRWFDPTDGSYSTIAASEAQNSARAITYPTSNSNANGDDDWVLVVDLTNDQSVTPTGPTVTVTPGTPAIGLAFTLTGPTVTATAGTLTVTQGAQPLEPVGPTVTVTPGTPSIGLAVTLTGASVGVTAGTVTVTQGLTLVPDGPTITVTAGTLTVTTGAVDVSPTGPTVSVTPGTVSIGLAVTPAGASVTVTPGTPALGLAVTLTAPTVGVTAGTLTVGVEQFLTPTGPTIIVTAGTLSLADNIASDTTIAVTYRERSYAVTYREHAYARTYKAGN